MNSAWIRLIELALIAAVSWPAAALLASATFRRMWPRLAQRIAMGLAAYAFVIIMVAIFLPWTLPLLAAAAVIFLVWERWRAWPTYGQSRDWPLGSLGITRLGIARDSNFILKQTERYGPIFKTGYFEPVACVVGHDRANDLLETYGEDMRGTRTPPYNDLIPGGFLRYMAEDDHARYRQTFEAALSPTLFARIEPAIDAEVADTLRMIADNTSHSREGENIKEDLRGMTLAIFLRAIFRVPSDTTTFVRMSALFGDITTETMLAIPPARMREAYNGLVDLVRGHGASLRKEGSETQPSVLADLLAANPAALDDPTTVGNLIYIAETGRSDVAGLLHWVTKKLAENPIWADQLRSEPGAGSGEDGLAARIVKETLRLEQSEYLMRAAHKDLEADGKTIPKGWLIRLCIREGHRDPDVFEDPESFDPDRFKGRTYAPREYAPFGLDHHRCLGAVWAEAIARLFVTQLIRDYDLDVESQGRVRHGAMHWEPGPDFRIRLTPRD